MNITQQIAVVVIALVVLNVLIVVEAFQLHPGAVRRGRESSHLLQMGLADMFKNALANDPSLPPAQNPGLSKEQEPVEVEFLPSGKKIKAYPGQKLKMIANKARVPIRYKCEKGDCGTCMVSFNGKNVKACQSSLPINPKEKKFTVVVPK